MYIYYSLDMESACFYSRLRFTCTYFIYALHIISQYQKPSFEMDHHQTVKMEKHQNSDFENTLKHAWKSSIQF